MRMCGNRVRFHTVGICSRPHHGAVHVAGGWGQALRMQSADRRTSGTADHGPSGAVGPEPPQGIARWPGARPAGSCRRRAGPAWATMSHLVPPCATLGRSFRATLCHFVPAYAGICRFNPQFSPGSRPASCPGVRSARSGPKSVSGNTVEARDAAGGRLGATRRATLSGPQGASSCLPDAPHRATQLSCPVGRGAPRRP